MLPYLFQAPGYFDSSNWLCRQETVPCWFAIHNKWTTDFISKSCTFVAMYLSDINNWLSYIIFNILSSNCSYSKRGMQSLSSFYHKIFKILIPNQAPIIKILHVLIPYITLHCSFFLKIIIPFSFLWTKPLFQLLF